MAMGAGRTLASCRGQRDMYDGAEEHRPAAVTARACALMMRRRRGHPATRRLGRWVGRGARTSWQSVQVHVDEEGHQTGDGRGQHEPTAWLMRHWASREQQGGMVKANTPDPV